MEDRITLLGFDGPIAERSEDTKKKSLNLVHCQVSIGGIGVNSWFEPVPLLELAEHGYVWNSRNPFRRLSVAEVKQWLKSHSYKGFA